MRLILKADRDAERRVFNGSECQTNGAYYIYYGKDRAKALFMLAHTWKSQVQW